MAQTILYYPIINIQDGACLILWLIVFCDEFQRFPELKHGGELMLTGVTAKTVAGQIPDLPILALKFQLIDLGAFHDRSTLGAIEADVPHTALHVVVMTAFSNIMADFHGREVIQLKAGIIIAGYIDIFLFIRSLEPGDDLGIGQRCGIEGDEMRSGEEELTIDLRISDADHTLVIGQLDLEVVSDINHTATQPFELPVNIDDISDLKIERIVVVGQRHVSSRKVDAHNRFPGLTSVGSRH